MKNISIIIRLVLALILFGCLLKMPYGYFQFVRVACFVGFMWLAYEYKTITISLIGCVGAAILFNPIFKIYFTRSVWNTIDVIVAVLLIIWTLKSFSNEQN
jgi:hypothetical protein